MRYRCRACGKEVIRGWLPPATHGLYAIGLLTVSVFILSIPLMPRVRRIKELADAGLSPEPVTPDPWWLKMLTVGAALFAVLLVAMLVNFFLELIEFLIVRRRPCPKCGAKRWSWGYTAGFGL